MLKLLFVLCFFCISLHFLSALTWNHIRNNRYGLSARNSSNHIQTIARRSLPVQHNWLRTNQSFHRQFLQRRVVANSFNRSAPFRQGWWYQRRQQQRRNQSVVGRQQRPTALLNRSMPIHRVPAVRQQQNRTIFNGQHYRNRLAANANVNRSIYSNRIGALQLQQHPIMNNKSNVNRQPAQQRWRPFLRYQPYVRVANVSRLNSQSFIRKQN